MTTPTPEPYLPDTPIPDPIPPSLPVELNSPGPGVLFTGPALLTGWSLQNHGAGSDVVTFFDGSGANGTQVGVSRNGAAVSETQHFGPAGIILRNGLAFTETAGTTSGTVYLIPLE